MQLRLSSAWMIKTVCACCEQACNGQAGSKWLDFGANEGKPTWLEYDLLVTGGSGAPPPATSYSLTSANDFPERDPADFRLEGLLWAMPAPHPTPSFNPSGTVVESQSRSPTVDADHSQSDALAQELRHEPATGLPSSHVSEAQAAPNGAHSHGSSDHESQSPAANEGDRLEGLSISAEPRSIATGSDGSCNGHSGFAESHVVPCDDAEQKASPAPAEHAGAHRKMGLGKRSQHPCAEPQLSPGATPHDASSHQPGSDCHGQLSNMSGATATANGKGRADELSSWDTSHPEAMRPACQPDSVEAASGVEGHTEGSGSAPAAGMEEWAVLDEQQGVSFADRHQRLMFTVKAPRACRCYPLPLANPCVALCPHMPLHDYCILMCWKVMATRGNL